MKIYRRHIGEKFPKNPPVISYKHGCGIFYGTFSYAYTNMKLAILLHPLFIVSIV